MPKGQYNIIFGFPEISSKIKILLKIISYKEIIDWY
jgi:hypothetical protein